MRSTTPQHPSKKLHRPAPGPPVTLGTACEWFWLGCHVCSHRVALKPSIFMNQLGPDYPVEGLRRRGWCTVCGSFGAYTQTPSHVNMIVGDQPFKEERSYHYHLRTLDEARRRSYLVYDATTRQIYRNDLTIGQAVQGALRANGLGVYTVQPPGRLIVHADNGFRVEIKLGIGSAEERWPEVHRRLMLSQADNRYRAASFEQYRLAAGGVR